MLVIISIICFLLLFKTFRSLESKEWGSYGGEWKPLKLARWIWVLMAISCLIPVFNLFLTVMLLLIAFIETRVGDLRFKGGKKTWLDKLIDFLSKEI